MDLKNKRVLITGGSLGIGKAITRTLSEAGAKLIITARHADPLYKTAKETGAIPVQMDVASQEDIDRTFDVVMKEWGGLDVLINNAGVGGKRKKIYELNREDFEYCYNVNVIGAAMMAQKASKIFVEQNAGHIINIGSTSGLKGYENGSVYSSSKFALRSLTECWRSELRKHNVRVYLINPSEVTTAIGDPDRKERPAVSNKLRPEEIAHTVKALLEMDERGFIPELSVWATNPW